MTQATSRIGAAVSQAAAKLEEAGAPDLARELVEAHYQRERAVSEREVTLTKIAREWQERYESRGVVDKAVVRAAFLAWLDGVGRTHDLTTAEESLAVFEAQIKVCSDSLADCDEDVPVVPR